MLFSLKAMDYWLSLTYWQVWKYDTYHKGSQITLMCGNRDNTMHFSASIGMREENLVNPKPPPRLSGFVALWQVLGFTKPWLIDPLSIEVKIHILEIIPKVWSALTFFSLWANFSSQGGEKFEWTIGITLTLSVQILLTCPATLFFSVDQILLFLGLVFFGFCWPAPFMSN